LLSLGVQLRVRGSGVAGYVGGSGGRVRGSRSLRICRGVRGSKRDRRVVSTRTTNNRSVRGVKAARNTRVRGARRKGIRNKRRVRCQEVTGLCRTIWIGVWCEVSGGSNESAASRRIPVCVRVRDNIGVRSKEIIVVHLRAARSPKILRRLTERRRKEIIGSRGHCGTGRTK